MNHIEFVGPSGAGKSTIHSSLSSQHSLYAGAADHYDISRDFHFGLDKIVRNLPPRPRKAIWKACSHNYLIEFFSENPQSIQALYSIMDLCDDNRTIVELFLKWCYIYQYNLKTKKDHESAFLDEGFCQTGVSVCFRSKIDSPPKLYLNSIPKPNVLIKVNAPVNICQQRQSSRERDQVFEKSVIEQQQKATNEIVRHMKDHGVNIINVNNNNESLTIIIEEIRSELSDLEII